MKFLVECWICYGSDRTGYDLISREFKEVIERDSIQDVENYISALGHEITDTEHNDMGGDDWAHDSWVICVDRNHKLETGMMYVPKFQVLDITGDE